MKIFLISLKTLIWNLLTADFLLFASNNGYKQEEKQGETLFFLNYIIINKT
jgi:hypothetical protein